MIEPRPANNNRHFSAPLHLGDDRLDIVKPFAGRIAFAGRDVAEQVMLDAVHFSRGRARRDDTQVAIDLHRVGIDDLTIQPLGQCNRER